MSDHTHECCVCKHVYECWDTLKHCRSAGVFKAIEVNGDGPYCELCLNLTMAVRIADNRHFKQAAVLDMVSNIWRRESVRRKT